jgi:peptidyl-tRNA hydrolase
MDWTTSKGSSLSVELHGRALSQRIGSVMQQQGIPPISLTPLATVEIWDFATRFFRSFESFFVLTPAKILSRIRFVAPRRAAAACALRRAALRNFRMAATDATPSATPSADAPAPAPAYDDIVVQYILIRSDLKWTKGALVAQACHGASLPGVVKWLPASLMRLGSTHARSHFRWRRQFVSANSRVDLSPSSCPRAPLPVLLNFSPLLAASTAALWRARDAPSTQS